MPSVCSSGNTAVICVAVDDAPCGLEKSVRYSALAPIEVSEALRQTAGTSWPGPGPEELSVHVHPALKPGRSAASIWACLARLRELPVGSVVGDVEVGGGVGEGLVVAGVLGVVGLDVGETVGAVVVGASVASSEPPEQPAIVATAMPAARRAGTLYRPRIGAPDGRGRCVGTSVTSGLGIPVPWRASGVSALGAEAVMVVAIAAVGQA